MVHEPQVTEMGYEVQAQNTYDIMSANTETLENDMDNGSGQRTSIFAHAINHSFT